MTSKIQLCLDFKIDDFIASPKFLVNTYFFPGNYYRVINEHIKFHENRTKKCVKKVSLPYDKGQPAYVFF